MRVEYCCKMLHNFSDANLLSAIEGTLTTVTISFSGNPIAVNAGILNVGGSISSRLTSYITSFEGITASSVLRFELQKTLQEYLNPKMSQKSH